MLPPLQALIDLLPLPQVELVINVPFLLAKHALVAVRLWRLARLPTASQEGAEAMALTAGLGRSQAMVAHGLRRPSARTTHLVRPPSTIYSSASLVTPAADIAHRAYAAAADAANGGAAPALEPKAEAEAKGGRGRERERRPSLFGPSAPQASQGGQGGQGGQGVCRPADETVLLLIDALGSNRTLQQRLESLDLSGNPLGGGAVLALLAALGPHEGLLRLGLDGTLDGVGDARGLLAAFVARHARGARAPLATDVVLQAEALRGWSVAQLPASHDDGRSELRELLWASRVQQWGSPDELLGRVFGADAARRVLFAFHALQVRAHSIVRGCSTLRALGFLPQP